MQGGWAAKNASTFARTRRLRNTTRPDASAPCAWKTRFAISNPIVLACPTDASSSGRSTPPPWHADAVRGRPSHHGPMELKDVLGEIESDGANLVHERLLEWALTPPLWHADAAGGRPHHQARGARSQTFPSMHLARGLTIQLLLGIAFEARLRTVAEQHEPCMPPLSSASLAYMLSGFGVGVLVGMTGVGGGSLMTPLLVLLFGIHPVTAVGTDLFFAAATKTAGTLVHGLRGTVRWGIVGRLARGSVPATGLTLLGLSYFDVHGAALSQLTTLVLAGALFLAACALIFRQPLIALYAAHVGELGSRSTGALTIGVGALLGMLVSTSSVGAGAI